jgi:hypothetical protein
MTDIEDRVSEGEARRRAASSICPLCEAGIPKREVMVDTEGGVVVPEVLNGLDFIKFCSTHRDFYYVHNDMGCFDCYCEKQYGKEKGRIIQSSPWGNWSRNDGTAV